MDDELIRLVRELHPDALSQFGPNWLDSVLDKRQTDSDEHERRTVAPDGLRLLLVDDEEDFRASAALFFRRQGHDVIDVSSGEDALSILARKQVDVAVIDVHMPAMDGVDLLRRVRKDDDDLQVVMLTGGATVSTAVASMKAGAVDYVSKPIRLAELDRLIRKAARTTQLQRENTRLRAALQHQRPQTELLGESPQIAQVRDLISRVASSDKPVLIEGESGTGKELVARSIHAQSEFADRPLVVINCAALPEPLLESELFGHEKGAFTGAVAAKQGLFEVADGGTLFIDEFGELAGSLQAKLLRVIEDGVIRRVGSVKERRIQVRLIAATNRDLDREVTEGRFREDLYYRINVLKITLPPLRQRAGDIAFLTKHFTGAGWKLGEGVLESLQACRWPGNVRQLLNALERGKLLASTDGAIELANLPTEVVGDQANVLSNGHMSEVAFVPPSQPPSLPATNMDLDTLNRRHVEDTLHRAGGNKAEAARRLGIHRRSLYRLLEKYQIS
ncbi:MAG: sigma-54 dependent transcriptional regulator [Planctomycetota bacterium]